MWKSGHLVHISISFEDGAHPGAKKDVDVNGGPDPDVAPMEHVSTKDVKSSGANSQGRNEGGTGHVSMLLGEMISSRAGMKTRP